jgi:hypothetical protein
LLTCTFLQHLVMLFRAEVRLGSRRCLLCFDKAALGSHDYVFLPRSLADSNGLEAAREEVVHVYARQIPWVH